MSAVNNTLKLRRSTWIEPTGRNTMVHPVVAAVVKLQSRLHAPTVAAVAQEASLTELAAHVALDGREAYGQLRVARFPNTPLPDAYSYLGATIRGERGKVGIFVSKTTGEPLPYPSDLSDVVIEWVA